LGIDGIDKAFSELKIIEKGLNSKTRPLLGREWYASY